MPMEQRKNITSNYIGNKISKKHPKRCDSLANLSAICIRHWRSTVLFRNVYHILTLPTTENKG